MATRQPLTLETIVLKSREQTSTEVGDEVVILGFGNNQYFGLDGVGARVWELIHEPRTVASVRDVLLEEYDVDAERCESELLTLLEELRGESLIREGAD